MLDTYYVDCYNVRLYVELTYNVFINVSVRELDNFEQKLNNVMGAVLGIGALLLLMT